MQKTWNGDGDRVPKLKAPSTTSTSGTQKQSSLITPNLSLRYDCFHCELRFRKVTELRNHEEICDKNPKAKNTLKKKKKKGSLHCSQCPETFMNWAQTEKHEKTHGTQFICKFCPVGFNVLKILQRHVIRRHPEKGRLRPCPDCSQHSQMFTSCQFLRSRQEACHMTRFVCSKCPQVYFTSDDLEVHLLLAHDHYPRSISSNSKPQLNRGPDRESSTLMSPNLLHQVKNEETEVISLDTDFDSQMELQGVAPEVNMPVVADEPKSESLNSWSPNLVPCHVNEEAEIEERLDLDLDDPLGSSTSDLNILVKVEDENWAQSFHPIVSCVSGGTVSSLPSPHPLQNDNDSTLQDFVPITVLKMES